ncbi:hypothetical protein OAT46_05870 [Gammaproteobacteria bacterium]|nr:hypothetical protein [Gammaproteobacteria bacterium]
MSIFEIMKKIWAERKWPIVYASIFFGNFALENFEDSAFVWLVALFMALHSAFRHAAEWEEKDFIRDKNDIIFPLFYAGFFAFMLYSKFP